MFPHPFPESVVVRECSRVKNLLNYQLAQQCSGCRADANEAAVILLPSNITVFALDFSGSGLSDGDYVSLGWHEVCPFFIMLSCNLAFLHFLHAPLPL